MCMSLILKPNRRRGFLLIEALATIVILSVSLSLIIHSYAGSMRAAAYASDYTRASIVLEGAMNTLLQSGFIEDGFYHEGTFSSPYDMFRYAIEARAVTEHDTLPSLSEVTLTVAWDAGRQERTLSATTYLFTVLP